MACGVSEANLCRKRGDTFPIVVAVTDAETGAAIALTGSDTFLLTVDPSPAPADNTANLFQLTGTVIDGPNGRVRFGPLSSPQANQTPGTYFYDVQWTNAGGEVRTILEGQWEVEQDVTK